MPALPPVPGVLKVHMGHQIGSDLTTGWHMFYGYGPTPPTDGNASSVAAAISAAYAANLAVHAHPSNSLTSVTVTDLGDPAGAVGVDATVRAGSSGGGVLPASTCTLWLWSVRRRYRGGKPRWYLPLGTDTDVGSPQTWTSTYLAAVASALGTFISATEASINAWGAGASVVNVSYYAGHTWLPDQNGNYHRVPTLRPVPKVDQMTGAHASTIFGSQRRRVRGR